MTTVTTTPITLRTPLPSLPAAWLAGDDRDLLAPLRLVLGGDALPSAPRVDRRQVAVGLERANRSYGHPAAAELARKLADPATRVVIAGQQPGLLGGPLFTLLKMVAAARWAAALSAAGEAAIPLFWVATEDHDWDEAAWFSVWTKEGERRLDLGADPAALVPLGMRTFGAGIDGALAELRVLFPYEPYASWIETLGRWYRPDARFGEAFCRLAVAMLGERCPLLVDAQLPEIKAAQRPLLLRLVEERDAVEAALVAAEQRITARGHALQVAPQHGAAPLFVLGTHPESGLPERRRVAWSDGERFTLRGAHERPRPIDELRALIAGNPGAVTPNVLSRPPLQDAVLGTSVQIMGPGELSYLPQAAPLYPLLGVEAPAVAPRPRALLLEEKQLAALGDLGLPAELLLAPEGDVERALAARGESDPVAPAAARALAELEALRSPALAWDPNLERPWEKTHEQVKTAFERFGDKLTRARAQRDQVAMRRLQGLREYCAPHGTLHERVLAGAHFRGRFGPEAIAMLLERLDLRTFDVQLLPLPESPVTSGAPAATAAGEAP